MDFDLSGIETSGASGIDDVLNGYKTASIKISSIKDLRHFVRVGNHLVHKSTKDLWELKKGEDGYSVERLFNADGQPLKG